MGIVVLEHRIACGSPVRIKGCPVIFKQAGSCYFISLNQCIGGCADPDPCNETGILQAAQRSGIYAGIPVYQGRNTVGNDNAVASRPFDAVASYHNVSVVDVIDKILLLVHTDAACEDIVDIVVCDDYIMKAVFVTGTSRYGDIDPRIPVHALINVPVSPVFPGDVADFAALHNNVPGDAKGAGANADSLPYRSLLRPIGYPDAADDPEAYTLQQDGCIAAVAVDSRHGAFPEAFQDYRRIRRAAAFGSEHTMPFAPFFQPDGVSGTENLRVHPFQTQPGFFFRQAGERIVSGTVIHIKNSSLFCCCHTVFSLSFFSLLCLQVLLRPSCISSTGKPRPFHFSACAALPCGRSRARLPATRRQCPVCPVLLPYSFHPGFPPGAACRQ